LLKKLASNCIISCVPLGLYINNVETQRIFIYDPVDAFVAALAELLYHAISGAAVSHRHHKIDY